MTQNHAGRMTLLGCLPGPALLAEAGRDPAFEIGDAVGADAELQHMERHGAVLARRLGGRKPVSTKMPTVLENVQTQP